MAYVPSLQLFQRACQETFFTMFSQMQVKCPCLMAHQAAMIQNQPVRRKRKRRKKRKTIQDQSSDSIIKPISSL